MQCNPSFNIGRCCSRETKSQLWVKRVKFMLEYKGKFCPLSWPLLVPNEILVIKTPLFKKILLLHLMLDSCDTETLTVHMKNILLVRVKQLWKQLWCLFTGKLQTPSDVALRAMSSCLKALWEIYCWLWALLKLWWCWVWVYSGGWEFMNVQLLTSECSRCRGLDVNTKHSLTLQMCHQRCYFGKYQPQRKDDWACLTARLALRLFSIVQYLFLWVWC